MHWAAAGGVRRAARSAVAADRHLWRQHVACLELGLELGLGMGLGLGLELGLGLGSGFVLELQLWLGFDGQCVAEWQ